MLPFSPQAMANLVAHYAFHVIMSPPGIFSRDQASPTPRLVSECHDFMDDNEDEIKRTLNTNHFGRPGMVLCSNVADKYATYRCSSVPLYVDIYKCLPDSFDVRQRPDIYLLAYCIRQGAITRRSLGDYVRVRRY